MKGSRRMAVFTDDFTTLTHRLPTNRGQGPARAWPAQPLSSFETNDRIDSAPGRRMIRLPATKYSCALERANVRCVDAGVTLTTICVT